MPGARPATPAPNITLGTPLTEVPTIAPRTAAALARLGPRNVGQLVAYLPMRHERLEAETTIDHLVPETIATARGEITATRVVPHGRKPRFEAVLCDETGRLDLVFFNQTYLRHSIHPGLRLRVQGKPRRRGPTIQMVNPKWDVFRDADHEPVPVGEIRIRPVYPASDELPSRLIERAIATVLPAALPLIDDHLPATYRKKRNLVPLRDAYRMMHAPETEEHAAAARRRLAFDELLMLQLGVCLKRAHLRQTLRAPALRWSAAIDSHIRQRFPFTLTPEQDRVVAEVAADISKATPTNRLLQGDVGSGKTVVALYAMLMAVASGHQAALMAPTELLAEQHHASIAAMLKGSSVRLELLTGTQGGGGERQAALARIAAGDTDIVIGTHALLTESVRFGSLAVAIIDEQHRFGVHQRAILRSKGTPSLRAREEDSRPDPSAAAVLEIQEKSAAEASPVTTPGAAAAAGASAAPASPDDLLTPHVLVMTATPIPRTMALTLFGDLDVSTLRSLPPGRTPITTRVVGPEKAPEVYAWLRSRIDADDQAYIVVPAIDTGGDEGLVDLRSLQSRLEEHELKGVRIAAMHGRLSRDLRETIMAHFRSGDIRTLIATTVIEVGVDVPSATIMVVEHAERFGLAQLHQLRGRVGRGSRKSVCILIGEPATPEAQARLKVMAETSDGFALAEKDLEIRGPGEVFGVRQAGLAPLKVADLMRDRELLSLARRDAAAWIDRSPALDRLEESLLRRRLLKAHGAWLGLGDVG
jgi:ATP-dependent DNA helicase RecG